jgi:hypothetical protein
MKCKVALSKPTPIDHLELFLGMFKFLKKKHFINEEDFVKIFYFLFLFPESLANTIFQHGIFKIK